MRLAFKKLFESGPDSAKTNRLSATIQEVESKTEENQPPGTAIKENFSTQFAHSDRLEST